MPVACQRHGVFDLASAHLGRPVERPCGDLGQFLDHGKGQASGDGDRRATKHQIRQGDDLLVANQGPNFASAIVGKACEAIRNSASSGFRDPVRGVAVTLEENLAPRRGYAILAAELGDPVGALPVGLRETATSTDGIELGGLAPLAAQASEDGIRRLGGEGPERRPLPADHRVDRQRSRANLSCRNEWSRVTAPGSAASACGRGRTPA